MVPLFSLFLCHLGVWQVFQQRMSQTSLPFFPKNQLLILVQFWVVLVSIKGRLTVGQFFVKKGCCGFSAKKQSIELKTWMWYESGHWPFNANLSLILNNYNTATKITITYCCKPKASSTLILGLSLVPCTPILAVCEESPFSFVQLTLNKGTSSDFIKICMYICCFYDVLLPNISSQHYAYNVSNLYNYY